MATNQDFDALIVRIGTATNTLENSVQAVSEGAADVEEGVQQAQAAATASQASATAAAASNTAAQAAVTAATTQATNAGNSATAANQAKTDTQAIKAETQAIADNLLATAPFQEAPTDGGIYGRQNAGWALVDTGGATPVTAVNGITPDGTGNVTVAIPDATSDLTNDSGFITVADIPAVPVQEAPVDGQQYARKDGAWSVVTGGGGGSSGYDRTLSETNNTIWSDTSGENYAPWVTWNQMGSIAGFTPVETPFDTIRLSAIKRTVAPVVSSVVGFDAFFTSITNLRNLPAGYYEVASSDFKTTTWPIYGKAGTLFVWKKGVNKYALFYDEGTSGTARGIYKWANNTWFNVGTGTA